MRAVAALMVFALIGGCGRSSTAIDEASAPPLAVTTVTASIELLPQHIDLGGVVQARAAATISSRIVASVRAVTVKAGDRVRAGTPIVLLDNRDLDAQARRAAAAVTAEAHAVRAAEADRDAAHAVLMLARAAHDRVMQLHTAHAATPRELDEAVATLGAAEARHAAAISRIAAATAALDVSRETHAAAAVAASFATVTAPFDGVVAETFVDPGDLASPGVPLVRVEDTRSFRMEVQVDESQAALIAGSEAVQVVLTPGSFSREEGASLPGRVVEIARSAAAGAHAFLVKIELAPAAGLRTGTFARARFAVPPHEGLALPAGAIVSRGQLPTVFVVVSGRARMRVVRVRSAGTAIEILAGLAPGEHVIVNPPPSLRDGDVVQAEPALEGS